MKVVQDGDTVRVHYTGRFPDGEVFDTSTGADPLEFQAGGEEVIPGVSRAVLGMSDGQKKTVTIEPADAYGEREDGLVQEVPLEVLPEGVKVGDHLFAEAEQGKVSVWIREVEGEKALLDGNHPLAGRTLEFDLELVSFE